MSIRTIKAQHKGFFPLDPMGQMRRKPLSKKRASPGAPKTKQAAKIVFNNAFYSLKEISSKSGISENFLRVSFNRWFGTSFTNYQRVARKRFVEKNANRPNQWLCDQLGITKSTLSYLIKDLKKEGRIAKKGRAKQGRRNALPLEFSPMALELMRLFVFMPKELSTPHLRSITQRSKNNITQTINELIKNNLIKKVKKVGQRTYYTFTPSGASWLRKMESIRKRKDSVLEKDKRAIPGIIKRKEAEKEKLINFIAFLRKNDLVANSERLSRELSKKIKENDLEVSKLRGLLLK